MALALEGACSSISSAMVSLEQYLFLSDGKYSNPADYSGYNSAISQNLDQVGLACGAINSVQSPQTITHLSTMMESMGSLFGSISEYQSDIIQRDVDGNIIEAFSDFCGAAWSMIVDVNETVTDCSFLASQQSPARFLQSGFFSIGQINPQYQTFYQTVDLMCGASSSAGPGASGILNSASATASTIQVTGYAGLGDEDSSTTVGSLSAIARSTNTSSSVLTTSGSSCSATLAACTLNGQSTLVVSIAPFGPSTSSSSNGAGLLGTSALSGLLFLLI